MDPSLIIQSFVKNISPIKILDMIAINALPIWIIYRFTPDTLQVFKSTISINIPSNEFTKILGAITNALVTINFAFLFCLLVITSIILLRFLLNFFIGFLIGYHGSYSNSEFRNYMFKMFATSYFRFAIYITALALYCLILFDNPQPLQFINESKAYWVSIFPTKILIVIFLIGLIIL